MGKKQGFKAMVGVLSLFLVTQAAMIVNPALANLAEQFPDVPYAMIMLTSTLASLAMVPSSIISGALVGVKVKYKTMAIISLIVTLIAGFIPYFLNDFYAILIDRTIVGLGIGLGMPLGGAFIMRYFSREQAANMQGYGSLMQNLAGIFFSLLAGYVCTVSVNLTWLVYGILIIPLVCVILFLDEPDLTKEEPAQQKKTTEKTSRLKPIILIYSLFYGLMFAAYYPLNLNVSSILTSEGIGTAAAAGSILSMYTIGGMAAGALFGRLYKLVKRMIFPICFALWVAAMLIGYFSTSAAPFYVSIGLAGFAIFTVWPAAFVSFGESVPPSQMGLASGLYSGFLNCGAFLASPFVAIVAGVTGNSSPRLPVLVGAVITAVLGGAWTIVEMARKPLEDAEKGR